MDKPTAQRPRRNRLEPKKTKRGNKIRIPKRGIKPNLQKTKTPKTVKTNTTKLVGSENLYHPKFRVNRIFSFLVKSYFSCKNISRLALSKENY